MKARIIMLAVFSSLISGCCSLHQHDWYIFHAYHKCDQDAVIFKDDILVCMKCGKAYRCDEIDLLWKPKKQIAKKPQ